MGKAAQGDARSGEAYLKVRNLYKAFGDFFALKDISLDIRQGEFVCFLGPSGCGKTTLLRAIAGLDLQTSGSVHQDGRDISLLPPAELLNLETEQKLQEVGFTASYSTVEAHERGEASMPLFIRVTYFHPVSGSGGQTPKGGRFQVGLTLYKSLWGGDPSPTEEFPGMLPGSR